jgi:glucosamine--fructose-6-phosphate aminotransferase (isomerizing)
MCGIIGYIGDNCAETILDGLKQLQNRGYDSAGITTVDKTQMFKTSKFISYKTTSIEKLNANIKEHKNSYLGIGHTRWATHGAKTESNAHPHLSENNKFCLVHNGIIENYNKLKKKLLDAGYTFKSETDTEVIVNLLEYNFFKMISNSIETIIDATLNELEGTWALAIIFIETPKKLYLTRRGSPLLISKQEHYVIVASEKSGFANKVNNYIILENDDLCVVSSNSNNLNIAFNTNKIYKEKSLVISKEDNLNEYKYWIEKEINEQVDSSLRAISLGGRLVENKVKLGGLECKKDELKTIDNLILLGCGTSYFAGCIGVNYLKQNCKFNTVSIYDGAEFELKDIPLIGKTGFILLSQSGETKDLFRCIDMAKDNNIILIGVVNVVDSYIAREVDCGCYLNAGKEVSVASTKSFTSQVILLCLISLWFAQEQSNNININHTKIITDLHKLSNDIKKTIDSSNNIDNIVDSFIDKKGCFILGKQNGEYIAKEGALKIKEISYLHAEGYSVNSLKHGPFALLDENFPVIMLSSYNKYLSKIENAYEEIKARNSPIIYITDDKNINKPNTILIAHNDTFKDFLCIIPLQILAYKLSLKKGLNPDMPRNLAKVVTVD